MLNQQQQALAERLGRFVSLATIQLPDDVMSRLMEMRDSETDAKAISLYDFMIENQRAAVKSSRPTCQDTGLVHFYINAGSESPYFACLQEMLEKATEYATVNTPLRLNAYETFDEYNTGTNTGTGIPYVEWHIVPGSSDTEITVYFAGGGCSLPGRSTVLYPAEGYEGIIKFVMDDLLERGINACPPLNIGIGIGGCITTATKMSKKALLRRVGSRNANPKIAQFEEDVKKAIDAIGVGPQGLCGSESVMGVAVEAVARHPATLAVSVCMGCWAHRRSTALLSADGKITVTTHGGKTL